MKMDMLDQKKLRYSVLLLVLLMTIAAVCTVFAEQSPETDAREIIGDCSVKLSKKSSKSLTDKKFTTYYESKKIKNPELVITSKDPVYGIYLCFRSMPESYEVFADGEKIADGDPEIYHVFFSLNGAKEIRVRAADEGKTVMGFNEVYAFSEGAVPAWVQQWEKTPEQSDILFFIAHPDEEVLYLGGAIPLYAVEKERTVTVASLTTVNTTKRSELLNSLWSMGYRNYPVLGTFQDKKSNNISGAYRGVDKKNGEEKVRSWVTEVIRRCKPQVIVAPDIEGEGSNGQRMMLADACQKCFDTAADAGVYPESAEKYGTWQPKKLYLHLYEKKQIVFDWNTPMEKLNGQTGMNLAMYAFLYYKTLVDVKSTLSVTGTGTKYANNTFGLYSSLVGDDDDPKGGFLQHIDQADLTVQPSSIRALNPLPDGILPELNENGYLDSGEFIHSDSEQGHWVYISPTLKIVITRKYDGSLPLTWFESEIWCDTEAGELPRCLEVDPVSKKKTADAADTAKQYKAVFAVNTDYYTYRVNGKNGHPKGIEVRNGEVYYDSHYNEETDFFPNLDTLAFYQDGTAKVHHSCEMSAQDYVDDGALLVYSFGPYLVREGDLRDWVLNDTVVGYRTKDPRHGLGMVEKGHYIDITAEGRLGTRSEGVTKTQLALLMKAAGCTEACNLDGGETAIVVFMGQQLNAVKNQVERSDKARKLNEILGIGTSEQVGIYEVK